MVSPFCSYLDFHEDFSTSENSKYLFNGPSPLRIMLLAIRNRSLDCFYLFSTVLIFLFLLSSIYIRRKYWIRENFRLPVFDGLTCFEMF